MDQANWLLAKTSTLAISNKEWNMEMEEVKESCNMMENGLIINLKETE